MCTASHVCRWRPSPTLYLPTDVLGDRSMPVSVFKKILAGLWFRAGLRTRRCLGGLVPLKAADLCSNPLSQGPRGFFRPESSLDSPVTALPGAWRKVSIGAGWLGASLWLGEIASLIFDVSLSVAALTTVYADWLEPENNSSALDRNGQLSGKFGTRCQSIIFSSASSRRWQAGQAGSVRVIDVAIFFNICCL